MAGSKIIFAGFGGQGILFSGKFLANGALLEDRQVSWLPSYGPEMRGGTANCSVIISDAPIGSPIIADPDVIVVMNNPSFDKYEETLVPGGKAFVDSSLITREAVRKDIDAYYIPATKLASDNGLDGLANMVMIGNLIRKTGVISWDNAETLVKKIVPAKRQDLIEYNLKALDLGYNWEN